MALDAPDRTFPDHPYLTGPFEPVHDELDVPDLPVVRGRVPDGLRGTFLRNGGNPAFPPLGRHHLFDGDGMLHGVTFDDGPRGRARVSYRNRFVVSAGLAAERRAGRALYGGLSEFALPPAEVVAEAGVIKNTANTHVIRHAHRILALMEGCPPTEVTAALETVGEWDFDGALEGPMTAHPKLDPVSGELVFFGYSPRPPHLRLHVADASGALVASEPLTLPGPVMIHDVAVTERHVVVFDLPAVFDLDAFLAGGGAVSWRPGHGARIGVVPRAAIGTGTADDAVTWTEVDPFYVFHFLNAHDVVDPDGTATGVVVDGCRADRLPIGFGDEVAADPVRPALHRWRIDLATGSVADEALDDRPVDFPRVAPAVETRPNRYGWTGHTTGGDGGAAVRFDGIVAYDLEAGTETVHRFGAGVCSGEPVFAPDPDDPAEDGGWLLTFAEDLATRTSTVEIVDARDVGAGPVASVAMPRRVPFGFHGSWLPA